MSSTKSSLPPPASAGPRPPGPGLGLALLSAAAFSTAGSFARSLAEAGWSPAASVAVRIATAAVMLAIPALLTLRGRWGTLRRSSPTVVLYGLIAVAGCQLCYFNAVAHLSIGVALLLEYLGTVLVVGWMWLRHDHRPRGLTIAGSVIAVLGLILVLDLTGDHRLDVVGVLWGLGAAFGLAGYFVLSGEADNGVPPIAFACGGMTIGALTLAGLGAAGALPMHVGLGTVELVGHQVSWLVPVVGLSLVAAAFAYVAGIAAARRLGPKLASFIGLTEVVFAVLFAWLVLGELPTGIQLAGGALIVAGVALVRMDELRTAVAAPAATDAARVALA